MRVGRSHSRHRSRASWTGRDVRLVAIGCAILLLIGGAAGSFVAQVKSASPQRPQASQREGAILFMQGNGNVCRQQPIDNNTGRFGEPRMVPCGPEPQTQKVDAFKDGFQRK